MPLSKNQADLITSVATHATNHTKGGIDAVSVLNLTGQTGSGNLVLGSDNDGNITATATAPIYIVDATFLAELENEGNWSASSYGASAGYAGQRAVSTTKNYFYECILDNTWVRYGIALSYFNAYLTTIGNDNDMCGFLEDALNWLDGSYVGVNSITNTYQGQSHYDVRYKYDAVDDNLWIRTPRQ